MLGSFLIDHDLQCFPEVSTDHQQQCQDETKPRYILLKLGCRLDLFRVRGDQNEEFIGVQSIGRGYHQNILSDLVGPGAQKHFKRWDQTGNKGHRKGIRFQNDRVNRG